MNKQSQSKSEFSDLPFHEYCAHCKQRFDETILEPTVTIVNTEDKRVLHAFCDEECLGEWEDNA